MKERPHGRLKYQAEGCRCATCRYDQSQWRQALRDGYRAMATEFVPTDDVREHIHALSARGLGIRRLGELTGIHYRTLRGWREGTHAIARRDLVAKVLAVPLSAADSWLRDSTGSARRIRALASLGWPITELAGRLGILAPNLMRVLRNAWVEPSSAEKIAALYDELCWLLPAESTTVLRARRRAVRDMWFPPLAWDDDRIDDPEALPCLLPPVRPVDREFEMHVQHLVAGHDVTPTPAAIREVVRRMPDAKNSEIAALVRCAPKQVGDARQRLKVAGC